MNLRLRIELPAADSRVWEHAGPRIRIGRANQCELCLADAAVVSSQHAQIDLRADGAWLSDCQSTNGTFLNDRRVTEPVQLSVGDSIHLGNRGPRLIVELIDLGAKPHAKPVAADVVEPARPGRAADRRSGKTRATSGVSRWLIAAIVFAAMTPLALIGVLMYEAKRDQPVVANLPDTRDGGDRKSNGDARLDIDPQEAPNAATLPPEPATEAPVDDRSESTPSTIPQRESETPTASEPSSEAPQVKPSPQVEPEPSINSEPPAVEVTNAGSTKVVASNPELFSQATAVLKQHCYRCHGEQGSNEGGFNVVLNRERLVSRHYVEPGKPDDSLLLARIRDGEMPPEGEQQISKEEIATLERWIEAGAPEGETSPPRQFVSTDQLIQAVADDLANTGERDRRFIRYFTLTHLYNAGAAEDELQTYRNALSKLVNSLSWKRQIVKPKPIDSAKTVLRIDLRDYDWSDTTWNTILAFNPYGIVYATPVARQCYRETQTELPFVRADWFVFKASRPPLYERVLRIPNTDRELEKMLFVDATQNIRQETVKRAGFNKSGVSQNNRLIERHESTYGAYWKSYDFAGNTGEQNLFQRPLGPAESLDAFKRRQAFQAAGGELIFNLPNGLQGYMLADAAGRRIDRGPTDIVSDPKQADRTVVNGISCMSCHYAGIIRKSDEIRQHVLQNKDAYFEADEILALYAPKETMDQLMNEDAERFRRAVEQTGSKISESGEPVVNTARRFEEELDDALAAAEVGMTPAMFRKHLEKLPQMRRMLGPIFVSGGTVKREVFSESFPELARQLRLGRVALRRSN